jgi:hypothetical protein
VLWNAPDTHINRAKLFGVVGRAAYCPDEAIIHHTPGQESA